MVTSTWLRQYHYTLRLTLVVAAGLAVLAAAACGSIVEPPATCAGVQWDSVASVNAAGDTAWTRFLTPWGCPVG